MLWNDIIKKVIAKNAFTKDPNADPNGRLALNQKTKKTEFVEPEDSIELSDHDLARQVNRTKSGELFGINIEKDHNTDNPNLPSRIHSKNESQSVTLENSMDKKRDILEKKEYLHEKLVEHSVNSKISQSQLTIFSLFSNGRVLDLLY